MSSSSFDGRGGMYPLDFTGRVEHMVILDLNDWSDLFELFTYPKKFLEDAFHSFKGNMPPTWRVDEEVTFVVEELNRSKASAILLDEKFDFANSVSETYTTIFAPIAVGTPKKGDSQLYDYPTTEDIQTRIGKLRKRGAKVPVAFVQFAVNSTVICIQYLTNVDRTDNSNPWLTDKTGPFTVCFDKDIPTKGKAKNVDEKPSVVRLHFDINTDNLEPEQINSLKARIALDVMENPSRLGLYMARTREVNEVTSRMSEPGSRIKPNAIVSRKLQTASNGIEQVPPYTFGPDRNRPTVIIEGVYSDPIYSLKKLREIGDDERKPVCGQATGTIQGGIITINRLDVKDYPVCPT